MIFIKILIFIFLFMLVCGLLGIYLSKLVINYQRKKYKENRKKEKLKPNGINYSLSFKEIKYLSKKEKRCPECNSLLEEEKGFVIRDGKDLNGEDYLGSIVKNYEYKYHCNKCNSTYTLSDLANRK